MAYGGSGCLDARVGSREAGDVRGQARVSVVRYKGDSSGCSRFDAIVLLVKSAEGFPNLTY
jgi:hypothetical protein